MVFRVSKFVVEVLCLCDEPSQFICLLGDSFDLGYGNGDM
jgi:hypothetical protein